MLWLFVPATSGSYFLDETPQCAVRRRGLQLPPSHQMAETSAARNPRSARVELRLIPAWNVSYLRSTDDHTPIAVGAAGLTQRSYQGRVGWVKVTIRSLCF